MGKYGLSVLNISGLALSGIILASLLAGTGILLAFFSLVPTTDTKNAAASDVPIVNAVTFQDNFTSGTLTGWSVVDETKTQGPSKWAVTNGAAAQSSNIAGGSTAANTIEKPGTILVAGNTGWRDMEYSVRMSSPDDDAMGVVFRYKDANNYYRFSMDKERNYKRLVKKVNGKYYPIAQVKGGFTPGFNHVVKTRAIGSNIQITVDNNLIFNVNDASIPQGMVGLYSWGTQPVSFDDVKVDATVGSFTIAVLPDTQFYAERYKNPFTPGDKYPGDIFTMQTEWIAKNRGQQKIAFALHEGDIVNTKDQAHQWNNASNSMRRLDGKVPYAFTAGNHDIDYANARGDRAVKASSTDLNRYFPVSRMNTTNGLVDTYEPNKVDNAYYFYEAGGVKFMVVSLQFAPLDEHLAWANQKIAANPGRKVIILTHDFLESDGSLHDRTKYCPAIKLPQCTAQKVKEQTHVAAAPEPGNDGQQIWDKLVKKHKNIQFVFSGHVARSDNVAATRITAGDNGNKVYQMVANYQSRQQWGGNGLMRLLTFNPAQDRVDVKTYSPYANSYMTDAKNQFTLTNVPL
jgi:hypothetical protein